MYIQKKQQKISRNFNTVKIIDFAFWAIAKIKYSQMNITDCPFITCPFNTVIYLQSVNARVVRLFQIGKKTFLFLVKLQLGFISSNLSAEKLNIHILISHLTFLLYSMERNRQPTVQFLYPNLDTFLRRRCISLQSYFFDKTFGLRNITSRLLCYRQISSLNDCFISCG